MNVAVDGQIRPARAEDIEAVVILDRALKLLPHWPATEYLAAVERSGAEPKRCLFVVERDGCIVGLASGRADTIAGECTAELESVGVAESAQRQGLGRALCLVVIAWCNAQDAAYVDLEVRSRSLGPVALYRELGFRVMGDRRNYYRQPADDALLMRLDLRSGTGEPFHATQPAP